MIRHCIICQARDIGPDHWMLHADHKHCDRNGQHAPHRWGQDDAYCNGEEPGSVRGPDDEWTTYDGYPRDATDEEQFWIDTRREATRVAMDGLNINVPQNSIPTMRTARVSTIGPLQPGDAVCLDSNGKVMKAGPNITPLGRVQSIDASGHVNVVLADVHGTHIWDGNRRASGLPPSDPPPFLQPAIERVMRKHDESMSEVYYKHGIKAAAKELLHRAAGPGRSRRNG